MRTCEYHACETNIEGSRADKRFCSRKCKGRARRVRKGRRRKLPPPIEGIIYILYNEAWPDWFKVGRTKDLNNRLRTYQTSSPKRDYKIAYSREFDDVYEIEYVFDFFENNGHEWVNAPYSSGVEILKNVIPNWNRAQKKGDPNE